MINQTKTPMRQVMAGCLGGETGFRLFVEGPYRVREIDLVIRQLEVARDAMRDEVIVRAVRHVASDTAHVCQGGSVTISEAVSNG